MILDFLFKSKTTIFHITHQKAGSQWLKAVFKSIDASRVVESRVNETQFFNDPIIEGGIYPALYCSKERFECVTVPENHKKFIVIRDIRDTLISLYFSMRYSHPVLNDFIQQSRDELNKRDIPAGLELLLEKNYIEPLVVIQRSWLDSGELIVKYEDLFADEEEYFMKIFKHCRMKYSNSLLLKAIRKNTFQNRTSGRKAGEEDVMSHLRKGIPGDWKNYFNSQLKEYFKQKYGDILSKTGYEKDMNW